MVPWLLDHPPEGNNFIPTCDCPPFVPEYMPTDAELQRASNWFLANGLSEAFARDALAVAATDPTDMFWELPDGSVVSLTKEESANFLDAPGMPTN